jgi:hypothetical protein
VILRISTVAEIMGVGLEYIFKKINLIARRWWITPIILANQEAEIRRIKVLEASSDK